jgi:hypothetical protein
MTNRVFVSLIVVLAAVLTAGSLFAHHAFAPVFNGEKVVRLKGVVTKFEWVNPHTWIIMDVKGADGKTEHWALEGPGINNLARKGYAPNSIKPGEPIEACGYGTRDAAVRIDPSTGESRHIMNAELLTLTDGGPRLWAGYGQGKCLD